MPQLSIYIDEQTLRKIEQAARAEHSSISKWVKNRVTHQLNSAWPESYFDLFGSLKDSDLERPDPLTFSKDIPRESL